MLDTVEKILKSVRSLLNESIPQFWTNEELVEYINEGMEDFCSRVRCIMSQYTKVIEPGDLLDGRELLLPEDFVALAEGGVLIDGRPLKETSMAFLDTMSPNWRREGGGEPRYFYLRGDVIGFYPPPKAGSEVTLFGFRRPKNVRDVIPEDKVLEGDIRMVPFQRIIRDYALSRAWEKKGDFQKSQLKRMEYEQGVLLAEGILNFHKYQGMMLIPSLDYRGRRW